MCNSDPLSPQRFGLNLKAQSDLLKYTYTDVRNGIFGEPPNKGQEERQAKAKAQAEVDAASASATDATNAKLRQRNAGRMASVLSTGAGKATLGA